MKRIHKKTGLPVIVTSKTQIKINGKWVDGICYRCEKDGYANIYTRTKEDFFNSTREL